MEFEKNRRLLSYARRAIDEYGMIEENDRIAVGISGGKDSIALFCTLVALKRFYPVNFEIVGITIDMGFQGMDFTKVSEFCEELGVEYHIVKTEISQIIFDYRKESNPCSLCARMRRGILHDTAKQLGCNKIALGHHLDDAAETFMMNLLIESRIGCFAPVTYLSRRDITMIRPLIYVRETAVEQAIERLNLPVIESKCPANEKTKREDAKKLLQKLSDEYGDVPERIIGAMQRASIDRWEVD